MSLLLTPWLLLALDATEPPKAALPQAHTLALPTSNTVPREPFRERPLLFEAQVGIAMPTGLVGAYVDYAFVPALSLAVGVGTNLHGVEVAAELRARVVLRPGHALGLMGGYSAGPHVQTRTTQLGFLALFLAPMMAIGESRTPASYRWDLAHWANFAVFYERRKPGGLGYRFFAGPAYSLNPTDARSSGEDNPDLLRWEPTDTIIFAGFGMGYAL